jgi:hypothetical protein
MKRRGFIFVLLLLAMSASTLVWAAPEMVKRFSDEELVKILQAEGYNAVTVLEPGELLIKINGRSHVIFVEDDGDLRAYYGITGVKVSLQDVNTWNRTKRLSRAFLDDENDPVLESDLLANAGMTPKHVTEFLRVFADMTAAFHAFVLQHDQKP